MSGRTEIEDDLTTAIGKYRMSRRVRPSAAEHPVVPDVHREIERRLDAAELEIHSLHSPP
jgi:hypothetical protein